MKRIIYVVLLCSIALVMHCRIKDTVNSVKDYFRSPETEPVQRAITTVVPLGYAAVCAMAAVSGEQMDGLSFSTPLNEMPGSALMHFTIESNASLPAGMVGNGTMTIGGFWSDTNSAVVSVVFSELNIVEGSFRLVNISTVPVERDSTIIRVFFAAEDVNVGGDSGITIGLNSMQIEKEKQRLDNRPTIDSSISVNQDVYIIEIDTKGTLGILTDDTYHLWGAWQHAGIDDKNTEVGQMVMVNAELGSGCRKNPTGGWVLLRNIGATISDGVDPSLPVIGTALMVFHNKCDGEIEVPIATGAYLTGIGKNVTLDLP